MAISKNFLIALCFISLLLFAVNSNIDAVHGVDVNEDGDNDVSAINEDDILENSQEDSPLQATKQLDGGTFKNIQDIIHYEVNDGDTIILNGEFVTNESESHIIVYKNITITSTSKATLNGNNISSIFVVETGGSGSSFSNLILKNGNGISGGAMMIYGKDVKITDCEFRNNYADFGGGAIYTNYGVDFDPEAGKNLLVQNCIFENNSARLASGAIGAYGYYTKILNCTFLSNWVYDKNGNSVYGGAMQIGRKEYVSNSLIKDCKFINNSAISISKEVYSHGGVACIREGVTYENCLFEGNSADRGGALTAHCSATVRNCTFLSNLAHDFGGALYNVDEITSTNLNVVDCNFEYNTAAYGGAIKLDGYSITVEDCNFNENHALVDGGAFYINSKILNIFASNFTSNDAKHNGGAVYVNGESTTVQDSYFKSNIAIANPEVNDDGLGGAIYINGTSDKVRNNVFEFNVARNGSAIYYDESGEDLLITNNVFNKNQAWVYALPVYANDIYYGESEKFGATIYGGNNIGDYDNILVSNSIYNAALNRNIKINGFTPVDGATNSGEVYQDSREYNIDVLLTVKHSDGTVVYNNTVKSSYLGESSDILTNLEPGVYTLTATHIEDNFYKAISNTTTFVVKPKIDMKLRKATQSSEYNYHDLIMWTINVVNNGPNNATNVKVTDVLPEGLVYRSHDASVGTYSNGVWDIGNLTIGESATLNIITLINKTGDITNNANVSGIEFDWDLTNNDDSEKISVNEASDLSITKNANVTYADYGDLVKWTIVVKNNGPDIAHNVNVTDNLPSGLILKNSNGNYESCIWTVGTLGVGESRTLEIITLVNKTGTIINTASVAGSEYDYDSSNNVASKTISVAGSSDLEVTKDVNVSGPNYGDLVKWTVTVRNNGPDAASGVNVTDVLPEGLICKSAVASKGSYSNGVWTVGDLDNGASVTLTIVCLVNKTGTIENVVSVAGNEFDYNMSNNNASKIISVPEASDLEVFKLVNVSSPNYGDLVKWTVTVRNNGPDTAHNIVLSELLPEGLIVKSSTVNYDAGKWIIDSLSVGDSMSFEIITLVNKTGTLTNLASAIGDEYDINKTNNNVSRDIDVPDAADLEIIKTVNNTAPNYLDLIEWTITVKNNGPDTATGVNVTDILPNGLIYHSHTLTKGNYSNGLWDIGSLDNGEVAILKIISKVNKTENITNSVNVTGNEYDINKTNNVANESISTPFSTDLEIIKLVSNSTPNYHDLVKWTIIVKNNGPDDATDVFVEEIIPDGLIVKNVTGNYIDGKFHIASLKAHSSTVLEIITFVNKTGLLINKVSVSGHEYDYNMSNNVCNSSINVSDAADLEISKIVDNSNPNYETNIKWIILVRNNGPDKATNVHVSEVLGEEFEIIRSTPSKGYYINDVWTIGEMGIGETVNLEIITKIKKTGNFTNAVNVSADEYDYDMTNNEANKSIVVDPSIDLEITKGVNNTSPNYNDLVKWTITIRNNGPDNATTVEIRDILPTSLEFIDYTATKGYYEDRFWKFCCLEVGEEATLEIITRVRGIGEIKNVAVGNAHEYDHNPENNGDEASINVASASDLQITKLLNQSTINYKESVKWTLIVRNNGPSDATGVFVLDSMPNGLSVVSSTGDGSYSNDGTWYVGELSSGQTKQINIITRADATGEFRNVATVSGDQHDYNTNNNKAEKSLLVKPAADLAITKTVSKIVASVGELVSYSIELTNNGPNTAENIRVNEVMDDELVLKSYALASGDYDVENHVWNVKSLGSNEKTSLNINAVSTKEGAVVNRVSAIADTFDADLNNNKANVVVDFIKKALDNNTNNSSLYSRLHDAGPLKENLVSKASLEMKKTGIPIGLLIFISLISLAFSNSNILKKR